MRDGAPNPLDEPDEVEDRRGRALAAAVEVEALEVWEDLEVRLCGGGEGGEGDARASLAAGALLAAAALLERQVDLLAAEALRQLDKDETETRHSGLRCASAARVSQQKW